MTNFQKQYQYVYALGTGEWLDVAENAAYDMNVNFVRVQSVLHFLTTASAISSDQVLFIDTQTNADYREIHDQIRDHQIDCSVIAVTGTMDPKSLNAVTELRADQILMLPASQKTTADLIRHGLSSQQIVRHRFQVERSYLRKSNLDKREESVLQLAIHGALNKQIASKLDVHIKTIERIRKDAYKKLDVQTVAEMVRVMTLAELYDVFFKRELDQQQLRIGLNSCG